MGKTNRGGSSSKRSARTVLKNERITRSSRSRLHNGLEDPAQVEKELNEQLRMMGLYASNTTGDGNCLFRALSDQLYGYSDLHIRLRQETCDHLASQAEKFAGFVDDKPFDEYVRLMRESGTYGGHLELHAFSQLKQKRIKVVQPGLVYVVSGDDDSPQAVRAREEKEQERLRIQNSLQVGSVGPPPSEGKRRRIKRQDGRRFNKDLDSDSDQVASNASESDPAISQASKQPQQAGSGQLVEAYGPLYLAYHNWEHYSSIRNLDGPHGGLPRIKERPIVAQDFEAELISQSGKTTNKGRSAPGGSIREADDEPTQEESWIMQSTSGEHSLAEIRHLMQESGNDWGQVVEILIERDTKMDEDKVGFELQVLASSSQSSSVRSIGSDTLAPLTSLPDHMRQWRAISPSSVDTSATQSSGEGDSPSTHATTDEAADTTCTSPETLNLSRGSTPGIDRVACKRAASADVTRLASLRSSKRSSQSRSPEVEPTTLYYPSFPEGNHGASSPDTDGNGEIELVKEEYEIIKRGRGRPRKDGLPNKSSVAVKRKIPTAREKRDAALTRKRERQLEKAKSRHSQVEAPAKASPAEVRGFRELKI